MQNYKSFKDRYYLLLKQDLWKQRRTDILQRDKVCTTCNSSKSLHVHHKYYIKNFLPWEYPDNSLTTLCKTCHNEIHKHTIVTKKFSSNIKPSKYKVSDKVFSIVQLRKFKHKDTYLIYLFSKRFSTYTEQDIQDIYWFVPLTKLTIRKMLISQNCLPVSH